MATIVALLSSRRELIRRVTWRQIRAVNLILRSANSKDRPEVEVVRQQTIIVNQHQHLINSKIQHLSLRDYRLTLVTRTSQQVEGSNSYKHQRLKRVNCKLLSWVWENLGQVIVRLEDTCKINSRCWSRKRVFNSLVISRKYKIINNSFTSINLSTLAALPSINLWSKKQEVIPVP